VTIVEFFDPACEACRAFHPIVKDIMAKHGDSVRVVLRYTPFHGEASEQAIRVLEAARIQGVFEPVLEAILREQPRWAAHGALKAKLILPIATAAGLDPDAAQQQMNLPWVSAVFDQDRADVQNLGVRQTPTFFVNGQPLKPFGVKELRALVAAKIAASE
jgi:protein-disulfide isomerase